MEPSKTETKTETKTMDECDFCGQPATRVRGEMELEDPAWSAADLLCDDCWEHCHDGEDSEEESDEEESEEEESDDEEAWFDNKYPHACCHRCDKKVDGASVVYCGGAGGACETWYCADCHTAGRHDCCVCGGK